MSVEIGGEGALDERLARPGVGQARAGERLGALAVVGEDGFDHRQRDRHEEEPLRLDPHRQ